VNGELKEVHCNTIKTLKNGSAKELLEEGSNNPIGVKSEADKISFHYYYALKDLYGVLLLAGVLCLIVFFFPLIESLNWEEIVFFHDEV
jgi:quinol-cytochrome oxidoreductase complex cytochrome b subunit